MYVLIYKNFAKRVPSTYQFPNIDTKSPRCVGDKKFLCMVLQRFFEEKEIDNQNWVSGSNEIRPLFILKNTRPISCPQSQSKKCVNLSFFSQYL